MHTSGSALLTIIERARYLLEEPAGDTQYSDAFIARQIIPAEYTNVMNSIQLGQENPIVHTVTIPIVEGTSYYQLPPCIRQIWRLGKIDDEGHITHDWFPRGDGSPIGKGWAIEGNMLSFRPIPQNDEDWILWFIPSVDYCPHKGDGTVIGSARTTIQLDTSPSIGIMDQRPNAYVGAVLRIINSGTPWQERIIDTHDVSTNRVTVKIPFDSTNYPSAATSITYEIAPIGWQGLWNAIAIKVAFQMGVARNVSEKKLSLLDGQYRWAIKAIRDQLGNMQGRRTKGFDAMTFDSIDFQRTQW